MPDTAPTFTDLTGCTWRLELTRGMIAAVKTESGVDLEDLVRTPRSIRRAFRDGRDMLQQLAGILFIVCEEQITAEGLSPEAFARLIFPPTFEKAVDALFVAVARFFPYSEFGRAHRATV